MRKIIFAALAGVIVFAAAWRLMALDDFQQNARLGRGGFFAVFSGIPGDVRNPFFWLP
jgi:hypothetical protein